MKIYMKKWGIYKIENLVNHKIYYGSSTNLIKRLRDHKLELRKNSHTNKHLQSAWNLYGEDSFDFSIVDEFTENEISNRELRDLETSYIQENKTFIGDIGYNNIPGGIGTLNLPCSEEKRKKISESNKGRIAWNKNTSMSNEQIEILKKVKTEKYGKKIDVYSPEGVFIETLNSVRETNRKYKCGRNTITDSCNGRILPKKWKFLYHGDSLENIGINRKVETEEHKEKRKNEYRIKRGVKVDIYNFNGELLKTVPSISAASEYTKQSETTIRKSLHRESTAKNFIYKYQGDKNINTFSNRSSYYIGEYVINVYLNSDKVFSSRYKKDIIEYLLEYRKKNILTKIMASITLNNPIVTYKDYVIKLEPALS